MKNIKTYDKKLYIKKNTNGSIDIIRKSSFDKKKEYIIFTVQNQFIGNWIIDKLKSMDTQRINMFNSVEKGNLEIKNRKSDDRQHRDIADFIRT
jgi:hypothetical protein